MNITRWSSILVLSSFLACAPVANKAPEKPQKPAAPALVRMNASVLEGLDLPFSQGVAVGNLLFLSGMIGNKPGTRELAPGGIAGETRQTLSNIKDVLAEFGSSMDRVVKCTVFLADIGEWDQMNEIYRQFFTKPPARSALGASGLALNARVEIECIATWPASPPAFPCPSPTR